MIENDKVTQAVACLHKLFDVDAIYLYGSRAHGNALPDSDYDIAVLCNPKALPSWEMRLEAKMQLEDILGADVDLLLLNEAGPIIAMQAVSKGLLLAERHRRRHLDYVMRLYSSYAEFKELRAPMEQNILRRRIYDR